VRRVSSTDRPTPPNPLLDVPTYWLRPFQPLFSEAGMHRFVWDLHGPVNQGEGKDEPPISAIYRDTPIGQGEWMPPGSYTVKLTVDGNAYTQPLLVKADPRH
jgi:hypothetical protein